MRIPLSTAYQHSFSFLLILVSLQISLWLGTSRNTPRHCPHCHKFLCCRRMNSHLQKKVKLYELQGAIHYEERKNKNKNLHEVRELNSQGIQDEGGGRGGCGTQILCVNRGIKNMIRKVYHKKCKDQFWSALPDY